MTDSIVDKINAYNTYSPTGVVQAFGGSIGRAAAAIAGIPYEKGVTKNKEYKAARRALERQLTGQHKKPSKPLQQKLNKAGRQAGEKPRKIVVSGTVTVNDYKRDRTCKVPGPHHELHWDRLAELAAAGDEQGVWDQLAQDYGVDSMKLNEGTIDIE